MHRRSTPALALLVACAPVAPHAVQAPPDAPVAAARVDDVSTDPDAGPRACPEPHAGARLRVAPDLRTARVAAWSGVYSLRPAAGIAHNLPGVVTGLLWSVAYANGTSDCRTVAPGGRSEYMFSRDQEPAYALYFPSQGEGYNFLRDWQVPLPDGGIVRYDAAMLGAQTGARHCMRACAHLATLEVNDGRGGRGVHFVATAVAIVDADVALDLPAALDDLRARFADAQRDGERELRRRYDDARREVPDVALGDRLDGPIRVEPTWLVDAAALEVLVWRDAQVSGERRTGTETVPPADCPPGSPCAYRESGTFDIFSVATIRSEVAARYRVDRSGVLIEETLYAPLVQATSGTARRRR